MSATASAQRRGAAAATTQWNDIFSSLISDIKTYTGRDPLLPWLRGIKTMKECLPAQLLKEKLPRFLQKCTQTFESDRRYKNDLRYIRVWLQLMDYVDDPGVLLKAMETNCIGTKQSLFYRAYALYYEKVKKYEEAEKMYHYGVQNLAEPMGDLKKSYEQFLCRLERNKDKKNQQHEKKVRKKPLLRLKSLENKENMSRAESQSEETYCIGYLNQVLNENNTEGVGKILDNKLKNVKLLIEENRKVEASADTVVTKFVDTAIVGKPQVEDACHHGLVEPTINMKEAIDTINSMFSEPIEVVPVKRKGVDHNRQNENQSRKSGFMVFSDEDVDEKVEPDQPQQKLLEIYIDDEETCDGRDEGHHTGNPVSTGFVFPRPKDLPSEILDELTTATSSRGKFREDTVVCRFVGSAILDDPLFENVCHHGLVDPTINLKEAMKDINSMFGKPIDYVRTKGSKKNERPSEGKGHDSGFLILPDEDDDVVNDRQDQLQAPPDLLTKVESRGKDPVGLSILPDDELELPQEKLWPDSSGKSRESDLFEPTLFTKEAMDDINKMFGMPMDF